MIRGERSVAPMHVEGGSDIKGGRAESVRMGVSREGPLEIAEEITDATGEATAAANEGISAVADCATGNAGEVADQAVKIADDDAVIRLMSLKKRVRIHRKSVLSLATSVLSSFLKNRL